eukprot:gene2818-1803_t
MSWLTIVGFRVGYRALGCLQFKLYYLIVFMSCSRLVRYCVLHFVTLTKWYVLFSCAVWCVGGIGELVALVAYWLGVIYLLLGFVLILYGLNRLNLK